MHMYRILIVEDDKTISMGLEYYLKQEDFEVEIANNFEECKKILENNLIFSLVLLDLGLPDGNGFDVFHYIKNLKNIPIIFLTAVDDEVNIVMGLDMGAEDYITKPFKARELLSRIRRVLRTNNSEDKSIINIGNVTIDIKQAKV